MINALLLAFQLALASGPRATAPVCETYAPNISGLSVTVCSGRVVNACDGAGNCTARN